MLAAAAIWRLTSGVRHSYSFPPTEQLPLPKRNGSKRIVVMAVSAVALFLMFAIFSATEWPGLHWDAWLYSPAVINVASSNVWTSGIHAVSAERLASGRHDFHGYLSIVVFGALLRCSTWPEFVRILLISNGVTASLWFLTAAAARRKCGAGGLVVPLLTGIMAGVIAVGLQGRPEHPAVFITAIPVLIWACSDSVLLQLLGAAITSGLCCVTSPQAGMLSSIGIAVLTAFRSGSHRIHLFRFAATGVGALLTAVLFTTLFAPFTFFEWFSNVRSFSGVALDYSKVLFRFDFESLMGLSMVAPFWNVIVLFHGAVIFCCLLRLRRWMSAIWMTAAAWFLLPLLADYGYSFAFPCLLTIMTPLQTRLGLFSDLPAVPVWYRRFQVSVLLMYVLAWVQFAGEAWAVYRSGRSISACHQQLQSFLQETAGPPARIGEIGLLHHWSCSIVVLGDASHRYIYLAPSYDNHSWLQRDRDFFSLTGGPPEYLIHLPENAAPPEVFHFENTIFDRIMLSGPTIDKPPFVLKRRRIGHEFAVYKKRHPDHPVKSDMSDPVPKQP
jgi:hypothetical protein